MPLDPPDFFEGEDLGASKLNLLSRAIREEIQRHAQYNYTPYVNELLTRTLNERFKRSKIQTAVIFRVPKSDDPNLHVVCDPPTEAIPGEFGMIVRPVTYADNPPRPGRFVWDGPYDFAYPDPGTGIEDFRDMVWEPSVCNYDEKPIPDDSAHFVKVQLIDGIKRVWKFEATGAPHQSCIVRDTGNGFQDSVTIQLVKYVENIPTFQLNPDGTPLVMNARIWPDGQRSAQFAPFVWALNSWAPACNIGEVFMEGGAARVWHLSFFRFNTIDRDPAIATSDCNLVGAPTP